MEKIRVREVHFGKPIKGLDGNVIVYANEITHRCKIEFGGTFFVLKNDKGAVYIPTANVSHFYIPGEDIEKSKTQEPFILEPVADEAPKKKGRPFANKQELA